MLANESPQTSITESTYAILKKGQQFFYGQDKSNPHELPEKTQLSKCIGVFDSVVGTPNNGGVLFNFTQPGPSIIGFKFTGATIYNDIIVNNHNVCYLTCDIIMSSYPSYFNGISSSVLAMIPLTTGVRTNFYNVHYPMVTCGVNSPRSIRFELRDRTNNIIKNIPYIVTITFLISK